MFYIGRFPEPYGGVTIKNEMLYDLISETVEISKFNTSILKENKIYGYISLVRFIMKNRNSSGFIGVSNNSLIKLMKVINFISPQTLKSIKIFAMGGTLHKIINSEVDKKMLSSVNKIYVELDEIKEELNKKGIENVKVIPNCRRMPKIRNFKPLEKSIHKIVFFSRINEEKGVELIFKANKTLLEKSINIDIDFYGPIDKEFKSYFFEEINRFSNLHYKGVINSKKVDLYNILNKYTMMLFPTQYVGEGFPGVLTEAKIAGIPIIATNWLYNSEIIKDRVDGVILNENNYINLANEIEALIKDMKLLERYRYNSYCSADKYFIENYIDEMIFNWN